MNDPLDKSLAEWFLAFMAFWGSLVLAAGLAGPTLKLLHHLKSRQTISQFVPEHAKKQGTPTMGGVIPVAGAGIAGLTMAMVDQAPGLPGISAFLGLLVGFAAIGFVDDFVVPRIFTGKRGLGWKQKFGLEVIISSGALFVHGGLTAWQIAVGVFLVLFFSNAYNFTDGLDGLAGGVGIFLLLGLIALAEIASSPSVVTVFACALLGGLIPFLILNAPPAKVFMGDVGSLPIGAVIGLAVTDVAFLSRRAGSDIVVALAVISMVMVIELVPVPLQIASVKLRKKRLFTMTPIHHGLEKNGWPETRIVWCFVLAQLILSILAATTLVVPLLVEEISRRG